MSTISPRVALFVTIACVFALCGAFLGAYLASPSDGTRIESGVAAWQRDGVVVVPLAPQPHGLRDGDRVVAIDGRSLESWSSALFHPGASGADPLHPLFGQRVTYTVVRGKQRLDIPVQLDAYPLGAMASRNWGMLVFVLMYALVGLFVYIRRPGEAAALVLFFGAASLLGASSWLFGLQLIALTGGPTFWLYSVSVLAVYLLFWSSQLHFSLALPHPSALTRTRPWLVPLIYVLPFVVYPIYLSVTHAITSCTLAWLGLWEPGEVSIGTTYVALAVVVMAVTYRRYRDAATRRKIRWVVLAATLSGGGAIVLWIIPWDVFGYPIISTNLLGLLLMPFPVALAIAILRYRLFDIDVIINRALVYGTLTAALALVYFVSVIALQVLVGGMAGQTSPLAIVGSTLASAALFQPLRSRIQTFIDRRFYRSKYDAVRTLEAFAATLHAELDLAQLSQRLVAVVEETMQPASVSLWLRPPERPASRLAFQELPLRLGSSALLSSVDVPSPAPAEHQSSGDSAEVVGARVGRGAGTGAVTAHDGKEPR